MCQVNVAPVFIVSRDFCSYSSMLCDAINFFFTILAMVLVLGSYFCFRSSYKIVILGGEGSDCQSADGGRTKSGQFLCLCLCICIFVFVFVYLFLILGGVGSIMVVCGVGNKPILTSLLPRCVHCNASSSVLSTFCNCQHHFHKCEYLPIAR